MCAPSVHCAGAPIPYAMSETVSSAAPSIWVVWCRECKRQQEKEAGSLEAETQTDRPSSSPDKATARCAAQLSVHIDTCVNCPCSPCSHSPADISPIGACQCRVGTAGKKRPPAVEEQVPGRAERQRRPCRAGDEDYEEVTVFATFAGLMGLELSLKKVRVSVLGARHLLMCTTLMSCAVSTIAAAPTAQFVQGEVPGKRFVVIGVCEANPHLLKVLLHSCCAACCPAPL
jgi:hypothetical protein